MSANGQGKPEELVTLTIDGREVRVPRGTNLIESARMAGIEIPYYCYHRHLSVPGNCRMCQVEVEGAPKLMIGCHTQAQPGMVVHTHSTSKKVEDAQASTLEMLLINHPLDCTVCDQAGHCKLQDYHYEYNARPSRFLEDKEHKPKAVPLGPTVMLDAERCIACTRCVRFCDEITQTSEIGLLNRGDRVTIAVDPEHELNNPLSGTVVDLCPVGALTHREWRFNTRIWYANPSDGICPGCSTGCNVRAYERDHQIVQVKARMNDHVNKEWLCDEGRYGFHRFLPEERLTGPVLREQPAGWEVALKQAAKIKGPGAVVLLSPDLLLEEYALIRQFVERYLPDAQVAVNYRERSLTPVEAILISPDYASNFQGAVFSGVVPDTEGVPSKLEQWYDDALARVRSGAAEALLCIGDRSLGERELRDLELLQAVSRLDRSVAILTDRAHPLAGLVSAALPGRSILEKQGLMVNRTRRLQHTAVAVPFPDGTEPDWRALNRVAKACGAALTTVAADRDRTIEYLKSEPRLRGLRLANIKGTGVDLDQFQPSEQSERGEHRLEAPTS